MGLLLKILLIIAIVLAVFFVLTFLLYWFNVDSKVIKTLEKPMTKHYDNIKRDRHI